MRRYDARGSPSNGEPTLPPVGDREPADPAHIRAVDVPVHDELRSAAFVCRAQLFVVGVRQRRAPQVARTRVHQHKVGVTMLGR
jgi:hypothetical protein